MTRQERLQEQIRKNALRQVELEQLAVTEEAKKLVKAREANNKRRYLYGARLDEKGFFALEDETLDALLDLLVPLLTLPDPVETLNRLIGVPGVLAAKGVKVVPEKVESNGAKPVAEKI
jgi:hypothetical protein